MTKALHIGNAARNGIVAAELAQRGFTGDPEILDGKTGFVGVYTGRSSSTPGHGAPEEQASAPQRGWEALLEEQAQVLGRQWELVDPGLCMKRWPCCYASHHRSRACSTSCGGTGLSARDIERVDVGFLPGATHPLNPQPPAERARSEVQHPVSDRRAGARRPRGTGFFRR
jgi:2-methylcitrate dehydratase PrpD